MHGDGERRVCPECGQSVAHLRETHLSVIELRGPRGITSSNLDRILDDGGMRFLYIEEKQQREHVSDGQRMLLRSLAAQGSNTVWVVRGTPASLTVHEVIPGQPLVPITEGGEREYQSAVYRWFDSPSRPAERRELPDWLDALAAAPYSPPAGVAEDDWRRFDQALTSVCETLSR